MIELDFMTTEGESSLSADRCGHRAALLSGLRQKGFPVPLFCAVPFDAMRSVGQGAEFSCRKLLSRFDGSELLVVRASPQNPDWGGAKPVANVGLNAKWAKSLESTHGEVCAASIFAEFVETFSVEVAGLDPSFFDELAGGAATAVTRLRESLEHYREMTGEPFPDEREHQLDQVIKSMAGSWEAPSTRLLRQANGAPGDAGQGLIVQRVASCLIGPGNGIGRAIGIDLSSGSAACSGTYRYRTACCESVSRDLNWLETSAPDSCIEIQGLLKRLRRETGFDQEIDFSLENETVWLLDSDPVKLAPGARVRAAVRLVDDGVIARRDALLRISPDTLSNVIHPQLCSAASNLVLATGVGASPGAVCGAIVFSSAAAEQCRAKGEPCILVRAETGPEDIRGMHTANGVLTGRGGFSSHAAVIARGLGVPCVAGAGDLQFDAIRQRLISDAGRVLREGDLITVDGTSGAVLDGAAELVPPNLDSCFYRFLEWAAEYRSMEVRANADTLEEVRVATEFNADGVGLCRTEHMFFEEERLTVMREMIFEESPNKRRRVLGELLPMQRSDFKTLLTEMWNKPVCIRLFDPPLHEFMPKDPDEITDLAAALNLSEHDIASRADELKEFNPMLGLRGVRLGIVVPEIYDMQARAIFEATVEVRRQGGTPVPEIMIPLVSANREVELVRSAIEEVASSVRKEMGEDFTYRLGLMVETPRAALRAGDMARNCEFLSFGTNDLTQLTYGISRDDSNRFMRNYIDRKVFPDDPFCTLDIDGVGELLLIAADRGRLANNTITLAICGEHAADYRTIEFCRRAGFNYVSCSPYRVPPARLALAQSWIRSQSAKLHGH